MTDSAIVTTIVSMALSRYNVSQELIQAITCILTLVIGVIAHHHGFIHGRKSVIANNVSGRDGDTVTIPQVTAPGGDVSSSANEAAK